LSILKALPEEERDEMFPRAIVDPIAASLASAGAGCCWLAAFDPLFQGIMLEAFGYSALPVSFLNYMTETLAYEAPECLYYWGRGALYVDEGMDEMLDDLWKEQVLAAHSRLTMYAADQGSDETLSIDIGLVEACKMIAGTTHESGVVLDVAAAVIDTRRVLADRSADCVPEKIVPLLLDHGVPCSSEGLRGHGHGAAKAIEMHVLMDKVAPMLRDPTTVTCMKGAKYERLRAANSRVVRLANSLIEEADKARYAGTEIFSGWVDTPTLVVHDADHHLSDASVAALFHHNPSLRRIITTGVHPAEAEGGFSALWPEIYQLRYPEVAGVHYCPNARNDAAYAVPLPTVSPLQPRSVYAVGPSTMVRFARQVQDRVFANHLTVISRLDTHEKAALLRPLLVDSRDFVAIPEVLVNSLELSTTEGRPLIPGQLLTNVVTYPGVLKVSNDPASIQAKLNSMRQKPELAWVRPEVWENLRLIALAVAERDPKLPVESMFSTGFFKRALVGILMRVGRTTWAEVGRMVLQAVQVVAGVCFPGWAWVAQLVPLVYSVALAENAWDLSLDLCTFAAQRLLGHITAVLPLAGRLLAKYFAGRRELRMAHSALFLKMLASRYEKTYVPMCFTVFYDPGAACDWFQPEVSEVSDRREVSDSMMTAIMGCGCVGFCQCDVLAEVNPLERAKRAAVKPTSVVADPPLRPVELSQPGARAGLGRVEEWRGVVAAQPPSIPVGCATDSVGATREDSHWSSPPATIPGSAGSSDAALPIPPRLGERTVQDIDAILDWQRAEVASARESLSPVVQVPSQPLSGPPPGGDPNSKSFNWAALEGLPHPVVPSPPVRAHDDWSDGDGVPPPLNVIRVGPGALVRPPGQVGIPPTYGGGVNPGFNDEPMVMTEHVPADAPLEPVEGVLPLVISRIERVRGPDSEVSLPPRGADSPLAYADVDGPWRAAEQAAHNSLLRVEDPNTRLQTLRLLFDKEHLGKALHPDWEVMGGVLGYVELPRDRDCALRAAAAGLDMLPTTLWDAMLDLVSERQMRDWAENGGTRVMLEVIGVLKEVCFQLYDGDDKPTTRLGHKRARRTVNMRWDDQHAAVFMGTSHRPPPKPLNLGAGRATTRMAHLFIKELDDARGQFGALAGDEAVYLPSWERARVYAQEVKMGTVGTYRRLGQRIFSNDFVESMYDMAETAQPSPLKVRCVQGFAGCGKSAPVIRAMAKTAKMAGLLWTFISPRAVNASDTRKSVMELLPKGSTVMGKAFNTFEIGMARTAEVVIMDEISLLPSGYIDLYMLTHPPATYILLGDLTQNVYHAVEAESSLNTLEDEALWFARKLAVPWLAYTHRCPKVVSRFFNIPTSNPEEGYVRRATLIDPRWPVIVGSDLARADKNKLNTCVAYTSGTAQGMTTQVIQVVVDQPMLDVTMQFNTLAAMITRSTEGVVLVRAANLSWGRIAEHYFFGPLLTGGTVDFRGMMRKRLGLIEELGPGETFESTALARAAAHERAHSDDRDIWIPRLRVAHPLVGEPVVPEEFAPVEEVRADFHEPVIHLPIVEKQALAHALITHIPDRLGREAVGEFGTTYLYNDERWPGVEASAFPYHARNDAQLTVETIAKRLRTAPWSWNEWDFAKSARMGMALWDILGRALDLPPAAPAFDEELFVSCACEQWAKRMEAPAGIIAQYEDRSDPLVDRGYVKHWLKTQAKTKMEAFLLEKFKAGAIISTCREEVIGLFGPVFRYCTHVIKREQRNAKVLMYGGMSPQRFSDVIADTWRPEPGKPCMVNDFSDFDSTQGGNSVWLEVLVMRYCGIPDELVDAYTHWKTHLRSDRIGPKKTSRDTGEPGTYFGNTIYSIAVTFARFGWEASRKGMWVFGGDDMATTHVHPTVDSWWPMTGQVKTVSKLAYPDVADFCGWLLTPAGIMRSPTLMFLKIVHNDARGVPLGSYLASYATELRFTYRLAGRCSDYLSTVDLAALSWCVRLVHVESAWLATLLFTKCRDLSQAVSRKLAYFTGSKAPGRRANIRALTRVQARLERVFADDRDVVTGPLWWPRNGFSGDRRLMFAVDNLVRDSNPTTRLLISSSTSTPNYDRLMQNEQQQQHHASGAGRRRGGRPRESAAERRERRHRAAVRAGADVDTGHPALEHPEAQIDPGGGSHAAEHREIGLGQVVMDRHSGEHDDHGGSLLGGGVAEGGSGFQVRVVLGPPGGPGGRDHSPGPGNAGSRGGVRSGPDRGVAPGRIAGDSGGHVGLRHGGGDHGPGGAEGPGRDSGGGPRDVAADGDRFGSPLARDAERVDVRPEARDLHAVPHRGGRAGQQARDVLSRHRPDHSGGSGDPLVWYAEANAQAADDAHRVVRDLVRVLLTTDVLGDLVGSRGHAPAGAPRRSFSRATRARAVTLLTDLRGALARIAAAYSAASAGGTNRNPGDSVSLSDPAAVQSAWQEVSDLLREMTQIHARGDDAG
jgi:hypothetical protein